MLVAPVLLAWVLPIAGDAPTSLVGEVVAVTSAGGETLHVRSDDGTEVAVLFDTSTVFLRARPGATTLAGAESTRAFSLYAQNLFDRTNPGAPVGNLSSPSFGESLASAGGFGRGPGGPGGVAAGNRSIELQVRASF